MFWLITSDKPELLQSLSIQHVTLLHPAQLRISFDSSIKNALMRSVSELCLLIFGCDLLNRFYSIILKFFQPKFSTIRSIAPDYCFAGIKMKLVQQRNFVREHEF